MTITRTHEETISFKPEGGIGSWVKEEINEADTRESIVKYPRFLGTVANVFK